MFCSLAHPCVEGLTKRLPFIRIAKSTGCSPAKRGGASASFKVVAVDGHVQVRVNVDSSRKNEFPLHRESSWHSVHGKIGSDGDYLAVGNSNMAVVEHRLLSPATPFLMIVSKLIEPSVHPNRALVGEKNSMLHCRTLLLRASNTISS